MLLLTHSFKPSTPSEAFTSFSPAIEAFFINGRRRFLCRFANENDIIKCKTPAYKEMLKNDSLLSLAET